MEIIIICENGEVIKVERESKPTLHVYYQGFELQNTPSHRLGEKREYEPRPWSEEPRRGH